MKWLFVGCFFISFFACSSEQKSSYFRAMDNALMNKYMITLIKAKKLNPKPVFGYRFIIDGDFDGDGKQEKLIEHFYSLKTNQETNKFYDGLSDYGDLVTLTIDKNPFSFITCDNSNIDTLSIWAYGQLLGISYLKNEGDLNGDGTDEVSYVVNWADWSSCNTWHIVTYKNKQWKKLYSFPMWDWQLPDLPETINNYGLFGLQDKIINTSNDSINKILEKDLMEFPGLVKKIGNSKIQIIYMNSESMEDSMIVDLRNPKKAE